MVEIKEGCYKGTRILLGNEKQEYLQKAREYLIQAGFIEISMPIIHPTAIFNGKIGKENNNMIFGVIERGGRDLCLAPEYTSIIQNLAKTTFKQKTNI